MRLNAYINDSIISEHPLNPVDYGFDNLISVFKEIDKVMVESVKDINIKNTKYAKHIDVYTDGSYTMGVGAGGFAYVIVIDDRVYYKGGGGFIDDGSTGNQSEFFGIYGGLDYLVNNIDVSNTCITVYTDSKYAKGCITDWYKKWITNGWISSKGTPVKNKELIQSILKLKDRIDSCGELKTVWVKGHDGNKYNELADSIAKGFADDASTSDIDD